MIPLAYLTDEVERVYWRVLTSLCPESPPELNAETAGGVTSEVMRARGFQPEEVNPRLAHLSEKQAHEPPSGRRS